MSITWDVRLSPINLHTVVPSYQRTMTTTKTITDEQAENCRVLYSIMAGIPKKLIDLDEIRGDEASDRTLLKCNSVACIAGWSSAHPFFKAKGLVATRTRKAFGRGYYLAIDFDLGESLFGTHDMFDGSYYTQASQKHEALARIRKHLYRAGRISKERNDELAAEEAKMVD